MDPSSTPEFEGSSAFRAELHALSALRRDLHLHPELSGEEARTAQFIADRLRALDIEVRSHVGGHGVIGLLHGEEAGPTIAYRADMDALPLQETLDQPYRSLHLGVSHACGHDAHIAIALGAAARLGMRREHLPGTVQFIFQPAEESLDGARAMIEDGALTSPHPEALVAQHVFSIPVGALGLTPGLCLAGMEEFRVRFYAPAGNMEAICTSAIRALEGISTDVAPTTPEAFDAVVEAMLRGPEHRQTVFLSCWRHSEAHLPPYHLLGLVSIPDFDLRDPVHDRIRQILDHVTAEFGATYDWEITFTNPPLVNDPTLATHLRPVLVSVVGEEHLLDFQSPYPFAHEDLSRWAAQVPTLFLWLGVANRARGITSILHTPDFDIDERALILGVDVACEVLTSLLDGPDVLKGLHSEGGGKK